MKELETKFCTRLLLCTFALSRIGFAQIVSKLADVFYHKSKEIDVTISFPSITPKRVISRYNTIEVRLLGEKFSFRGMYVLL